MKQDVFIFRNYYIYIEKIDDKDKQGLKDQANDVTRKVNDVAKTVDKVANSPEVNIIGSIAGGDTKDKIKDGQKVTGDIERGTRPSSLP